MNKELWNKAKILASRNYTIEVSKDKTGDGQTLFMAKNPELYGCMAQGSSIKEAINNLYDARVDYIYSLLEDGLDVPEPTSLAVQTAEVEHLGKISIEPSEFVGNIDMAGDTDKSQDSLYEALLRA